MEIRAQQTDRIGKAFLTMRANGRYLGTLFCSEEERDVLLDMLDYGAKGTKQHEFVSETREK